MMRVSTGFVLAACLAVLFACSEKDEPAESEPEPPAGETAEPAAEARGEGAAEPDESPVEVGEELTPLYSAATGAATALRFETRGTVVSFTAEPGASAEGIQPVVVRAAVGDGEAEQVFACEDLNSLAGGTVSLLRRGEHVHILCINPPQGGDVGETQAIRVRLDEEGASLSEDGSYGGEGLVDPDTIDLDEGG